MEQLSDAGLRGSCNLWRHATFFWQSPRIGDGGVSHFVEREMFSDVAVHFWEIAGTRNAVFCHTKCVSEEASTVSSAKQRVRDDKFVVPSCRMRFGSATYIVFI